MKRSRTHATAGAPSDPLFQVRQAFERALGLAPAHHAMESMERMLENLRQSWGLGSSKPESGQPIPGWKPRMDDDPVAPWQTDAACNAMCATLMKLVARHLAATATVTPIIAAPWYDAAAANQRRDKIRARHQVEAQARAARRQQLMDAKAFLVKQEHRAVVTAPPRTPTPRVPSRVPLSIAGMPHDQRRVMSDLRRVIGNELHRRLADARQRQGQLLKQYQPMQDYIGHVERLLTDGHQVPTRGSTSAAVRYFSRCREQDLHPELHAGSAHLANRIMTALQHDGRDRKQQKHIAHPGTPTRESQAERARRWATAAECAVIIDDHTYPVRGRRAHRLAHWSAAEARGDQGFSAYDRLSDERYQQTLAARNCAHRRNMTTAIGVMKRSKSLSPRGQFTAVSIPRGPGSSIIYASEGLDTTDHERLVASLERGGVKPKIHARRLRKRFEHLILSWSQQIPADQLTDQRMLCIAVAAMELMGLDPKRHRLVMWRHRDTAEKGGCHHLHVYIDRVRDDGAVWDMDALVKTKASHLTACLLSGIFLHHHGAGEKAALDAPSILKSLNGRTAAVERDMAAGKLRYGMKTQSDPSDYHGDMDGHQDQDDPHRHLFSRRSIVRALHMAGTDAVTAIPAGFIKWDDDRKNPRDDITDEMTTHRPGSWRSVPTTETIRHTRMIEHEDKILAR